MSRVPQRERSDMQKVTKALREQVLKFHEILRALRNMKLEVYVVFESVDEVFKVLRLEKSIPGIQSSAPATRNGHVPFCCFLHSQTPLGWCHTPHNTSKYSWNRNQPRISFYGPSDLGQGVPTFHERTAQSCHAHGHPTCGNELV